MKTLFYELQQCGRKRCHFGDRCGRFVVRNIVGRGGHAVVIRQEWFSVLVPLLILRGIHIIEE